MTEVGEVGESLRKVRTVTWGWGLGQSRLGVREKGSCEPKKSCPLGRDPGFLFCFLFLLELPSQRTAEEGIFCLGT